MWERLQIRYAIPEVIGLSCTLDPDESLFSLCHIKRKANSIDMVAQRTFSDKTEMYSYYLARKRPLPIALHIQGSAVLVKELEGIENPTTENILSVFPNYSEEAYVYSYIAGKESGWLTLMKKTHLEELLGQLEDNGLDIVRIFIGPAVVSGILDQLNGYSGNFSFDGHLIQRDSETGQWTTYAFYRGRKATYSLKIQGMDIEEQYIMAYSASFSLLMYGFVGEIYVGVEAVDARFDDLLQKRKFQTNGAILLISFFLLLLINYMFYVYYQGKYEEQEYLSRENFSNVNEGERLLASVSANDTLLRQLGWNGGVSKSWIINQLGKSLEGQVGISWETLEINPQVERRFGTKVQEMDSRYKISITGGCLSLRELESWVRKLGQKRWVERVEISGFGDQNKSETPEKSFRMTLWYTDDF